MITIDFSKRKGQGLSDFLYSSIKRQIVSNSIAADERLPSRRALAQNLKVSEITVQNAYARLISEGYIYSEEKRGYFAQGIPSGGTLLADAARKIPQEDEEPQKGKDANWLADFKSNSTNFEKFPFSLWAHLMRQVLNSGDERLLQKIPSGGADELRKAISRHLRRFRMIEASPEQIVIGAGTDFLYTQLVHFFGADKTYAVENPGYRQFASVAKLCGAKCVAAGLDKSGIKTSKLKDAQIVHVSPLHHFPTGIVMPYARRFELLEWAASEKKRFIIEDDYDSEFRFNAKPIEPLFSAAAASEKTRGHVIYINTFSKTLAPSIRISYMILPQNLVQEYYKKNGFYSCPVSAFEQYTLARFIDEGHYEKHLTKMKNHYRNLRNDLIRALSASRLSKSCEILEENSGLHFILRIKSTESGKKLQGRLSEKGINVALLSDFYYNKPKDQSSRADFVINYSGIQKNKIAQIVKKMEAALC